LRSTLYAALRRSCRSARHSFFYEPDMGEVGKLSSARHRYAERLLERLAREREGAEQGGGGKRGDEDGGDGRCATKTFCVGVVGTEKRLDLGYLLQSVASLRGIGGVGADCRTDRLFVRIRGDPLLPHEPRQEKEVHADVRLMLDAGIDVDLFASPYRVGQTYVDGNGVEKIYRLDATFRGKRQWLADEADDYRRALGRCLSESPRSSYVVIVEEDVFATRDLMGKLSAAVDFLETEHEGEWSSLKLFVTDYWQNWERTPADVALLVAGGVLFACFCEALLKAFDLAALSRRWRSVRKRGDDVRPPPFEGAHSATGRRFQRGMRGKVDGGFVVEDLGGFETDKRRGRKGGLRSFRTLCTARAPARGVWKWVLRTHFFALGIATLLAVSKQALNLSRVSRTGIYADDLGAHTLGMVFPRQVAAQIVPFLEGTEGRSLPIDELLVKFNEEVVGGGRGQFIVVPSLLQHTGAVSSSTWKYEYSHSHGELNFYRNHMKLASRFDDLSAEELDRLP